MTKWTKSDNELRAMIVEDVIAVKKYYDRKTGRVVAGTLLENGLYGDAMGSILANQGRYHLLPPRTND